MHGPSLAPELWNMSVVILLCGLMCWLVRLVRLMFIYLEACVATQQHAVIHLEKLGPSLHILGHASMWHFHQLLRTQLQIASTTMKRVRIPFEIVGPSMKLVASADEQQRPLMNLSVEVKSDSKCEVHVFWDVKASALASYLSPTSTSTDRPLKRRMQQVNAALPTRAARTAFHAMRSLPGKIYDLDMRTPHRLLKDDMIKNSERVTDSPKAGLCLTRLFVEGLFQVCSLMERSKGGSPDEFVASIPSELLDAEPRAQESSIQSSVVATDCEDEKSPDPVTPNVGDPRYACVIVIGPADPTSRSKVPGFNLNKLRPRGSTRLEDAVEDEVVCQCVAIDFVPTPGNLSRAPVIVKKLIFTATNVFTSQEIFTTGGECVICLERPLASILLPCRHLCVCRECLEEIDQCPICRSKFSTYACYQQPDSSNHIQLNVML